MARLAAIQMVSGNDLDDNLKQAASLLQQAAEQGAQLAVLPENFALFATDQTLAFGQREARQQEVLGFLRAQAAQHGLWIVGGSIPTGSRPDGSLIDGKVRSTCWVIDATGEIAGRYDKIHLFDVQVADGHGQYLESKWFEAGDSLLILDTPFGRLGVAICYDLRFPELFRQMQTAEVDLVALPAAFTQVTGAAHWHVLLRARAIENQFYLVAADQGGKHSERRETYSHSLILDPWGDVLSECPTGPGVVLADLDPDRLSQIRQRMPVRDHRRL